MLELYLIWIKYFYEKRNSKNIGNLDKKNLWGCGSTHLDQCDLYHLYIPGTVYRAGTLLYRQYNADIWVTEYVL